MAKTHARYSPSKLDSLSGCIRFKYKEREDDSADEGSMLHKACETGITVGLNEEQDNAVSIARGYSESILAGDGGPGNWTVMREVRLALLDLTYGHADFVAVHNTKPLAHVLDYKFTRTEGKHDFQVRTYGAALVSMLAGRPRGEPIVFKNEEGVDAWVVPARALDTVHTHVCAPRLHDPYESEYPADQLVLDVVREIEELYARIEDPFLPPTPRVDLCQNCARASRCPAMTAVAVHAAKSIGLPVPETFSPDSMVSDRDRAIAQALKGALENWAEQVSKFNTEYVKAGGVIPGFRLQSRSTGIKVLDGGVRPAIETLVASGEFTWDDIYEALKLSPSELAKHKAATSTLTEGEAKELVKTTLGSLAVEGSCTFLTKVKRVSDIAMVQQLTQGDKV